MDPVSADATKEAVMRGALLLDVKHPGWRSKITEKIRMKDPCKCILGQLFHDYNYGRSVILGLSPEQSVAFGFDLPRTEVIRPMEDWDRLTALWTEEVESGTPRLVFEVSSPQILLPIG